MNLNRILTSSKRPTGRFAGGQAGFTLIELLVVIAIIGILSTMGISSFQSAARSGRDGKRKGDLSQIRAALELYRSNPPPPATGYPTGSISSMLSALKNAGYMSDPLPADPKTSTPYIYTPGTGTYVLCAHLEVTGSGNSSSGTSVTTGGSLDYLCFTQP